MRLFLLEVFEVVQKVWRVESGELGGKGREWRRGRVCEVVGLGVVEVGRCSMDWGFGLGPGDAGSGGGVGEWWFSGCSTARGSEDGGVGGEEVMV